MHPYLSPTGGGITSDPAIANRMRELRDEYRQAYIDQDEESKKRVLGEESRLIKKSLEAGPQISQELKEAVEIAPQPWECLRC